MIELVGRSQISRPMLTKRPISVAALPDPLLGLPRGSELRLSSSILLTTLYYFELTPYQRLSTSRPSDTLW